MECSQLVLMSREQYGQKIPFLDELIEALDEDQDLGRVELHCLGLCKAIYGQAGASHSVKAQIVKAVKDEATSTTES